MMTFRSSLVVTLLVISGCATVTQTYTPDGRVGLNINCSGTARNWSACLSAAGEACGKSGYDVLDRVDTFRVDMYGQSIPQREMLISCKKTDSTTQRSESEVDKGMQPVSTGTCFFVSASGSVITNEHVLADSNTIVVEDTHGNKLDATVKKRDHSNDLALLDVSADGHPYLPFAPLGSLAVGQEVFTMGYPVTEILGAEPKFSDGVISSLTGYRDAPNVIQMTVPLQPGNSGGPVVNERGEVVAIATSTAAIESFFGATGALPQNVNWAIKADYAYLLVQPSLKPVEPSSYEREELIDRTRSALCRVVASQ